MDHSEAISSRAAERYLLGEMDARVREEYEEHFFSCAECAREVQAGAVFIDNARDVLSSERASAAPARAPERPAMWWGWFLRPAFAVPALAVLLVVLGYQNFFAIPHMRSELARWNAPETLPSFSLLGANSRGGAIPDIAIPRSKPLALFVDIPPEKQFPSYVCEVQNDSGAAAFSVSVSPEEAKQTVTLLIPPSRLTAGKYVLIVRGYSPSEGSGATEVARYSFTLKYSD